jgi:hypothetical protein
LQISGKELHITLTPFLEKNTSLFMKVGVAVSNTSVCEHFQLLCQCDYGAVLVQCCAQLWANTAVMEATGVQTAFTPPLLHPTNWPLRPAPSVAHMSCCPALMHPLHLPPCCPPPPQKLQSTLHTCPADAAPAPAALLLTLHPLCCPHHRSCGPCCTAPARTTAACPSSCLRPSRRS